jgi:hypothetical protein
MNGYECECEVCGVDIHSNYGHSLDDGRFGCWRCCLKDIHNNDMILRERERLKIERERINNRFEILDL